MYRIDEDTYIDDSLITCAEYQLFLDEMHAQDKFYQPDHWTVYQFPTGQAHVPILGVRLSDATTFCKWLSNRDTGEWSYRLPTLNEAARYPIAKKNKWLSGFWVLEAQQFSFAWIGPPPTNPRAINLDLIYTLDFIRTRENILSRMRNLVRDKAHGLVQALGIHFDAAIIRALDIIRSRKSVLNLDIALDLDRLFYPNLVNQLKANYYKDDDNILILYIWVDLITLQERVAGRSPAFEGIRLVKTRISSKEHQT